MNIPVIVFVAVLVAVLSPYFLFVVRPEDKDQRKLKKRLKEPGGKRLERAAIVKEAEQLSSVRIVDKVLGQATRIVGPLQRFIERSGVRMTPAAFLLATGCAAGVPWLLVTWTTGQVLVASFVAACTGAIPYLWLRRATTKRLRKFEEQFPEGIDLIARALRAGHTFQTGLSMVADEIEAPVGTEFRLLFDRQNFGMPITEALRSFAERVPLLDAKFFATAVLTQRDAGGNMAEVLDNLSCVIRDRFKVKRQVRVISAHGRITGWILAGLPPALSTLFLLVSPKHMQTLFTDPLGRQMIVVAILLQVLGTVIIRKIVDIEYEKRNEPNMPFEFWLTIVAVFLSVGLISGSAMALVLAHNAPGRRRLRGMASSGGGTLLKDTQSLMPSLTPAIQRLASFIPKSPKEMSRLQKRMAHAGYHGLTPALIFTACELILPVVMGGIVFLVAHGQAKVLLAILAGMTGYITPGIVLRRLTNQRKKIIENGLPDALDLFIVCLEAGSALDQAILKTSQDLDVPYPPLAEELRMITTEMRAGKPRLEAFKNFATRSGVDDVRALVSMLVQSDRFGTSIAQALRTHAETSRTKRRQRAEERAAKIGVKMVFPLVFCLFPAFSVVTVGPGVVQLIRFFSQQLVK